MIVFSSIDIFMKNICLYVLILCLIFFCRFKTTGLLRSHQKSHLKDESHQKIDVGEPLVMTTQGYLQAPARHRAVYQPTR